MIQQAIRTIRTLLPSGGSVTIEEIANAVNTALSIPQYAGLDREALIREVQSIYNIRLDDFRVIEAEERRKPWIKDKKGSIIWNFWNRYRDYLADEKNFSETVINQLDRLTDRTLDGLFDPNVKGVIDKKGLIVGQVQSGKTANYTGLVCKAADAGYKLIIVLAGIYNNLRSQTQLRLDEGFLGFDTQHERAFRENNLWIGVGRGRTNQDSTAHSLTSSLSDFNVGAANAIGINFNTNEPIIAVVKKNGKILVRLLQWLSAQAVETDGRRVIRNKSLMLIDDEADNASINTNPENDRTTRINGLIRDILRLFDKRGYIGCTATPFANIFIPIEEDELFPRDFIINLPAPSNYIGPDKVFGFQMTEDNEVSDIVLPIVNRINDYQNFVPNRHKRDDPLPSFVPESLKLAINSFILTCAIRQLRGQVKVHNSMLVHVSRYTNWQQHIKQLVENVFDFYRRGIEMNIPSIIEELRQAFEENTETYKSFRTTSKLILDSQIIDVDPHVQVHKWADVLPHLNGAATKIQVREINGGSADALNYFDHKNGLSVIAIGGDKLSRGLTLEGLSVSYYLRASRMYDTLMQMGRWFGYRPGYVDLCRLFTSRELNEWFCHIALASDELRNEFDYMADVAGSTPEQYALRVRTHPGVLQISASNKIRRAASVEISWAGRLVESYQLQKNKNVIQANLKATEEFICSLNDTCQKNRNNYLWFDVPAERIISFFQRFRVPDTLKKVDPNNLLQFIDAQLRNGELTDWRVGVMSKKETEERYKINRNREPLDIGLWMRTNAGEMEDINTYFIRKNHIISPKDEFIDLTPLQFEEALKRTKEKNKEYKNDFPKGEIVRNEFRNPKNPLLLIYYLSPVGAGLPKESDPLVGFAVSFPKSNFHTTIRYAVHEQLLPLFNIDDTTEEPEEYDED